MHSSHIRLLIFSLSKLINYAVAIENEEWNCNQINTNLFVVPWTPQKYKHDINYITVKVKTFYGKLKEVRKVWENFFKTIICSLAIHYFHKLLLCL